MIIIDMNIVITELVTCRGLIICTVQHWLLNLAFTEFSFSE